MVPELIRFRVAEDTLPWRSADWRNWDWTITTADRNGRLAEVGPAFLRCRVVPVSMQEHVLPVGRNASGGGVEPCGGRLGVPSCCRSRSAPRLPRRAPMRRKRFALRRKRPARL